jgi:co-chaperonin GroES (HSP10)
MTPVVEELDRIQGVMEPVGYRLLVRIPNLAAQMKNWGNLYRPDETRALEEGAQLVGQVIAMGPDAYQDKAKFPTGPWCKVGDFVMMRAYAGTRFVVRTEEGEKSVYALINDDTVQGIVRGNKVEDIERPS